MSCKGLKFRHTINIQKRALMGQTDGTGVQTMTTLFTIGASVKTRPTVNMFNAINIDNPHTHEFTVRYNPTFEDSTQFFINFNNKLYDILTGENIEEKNLYYKFFGRLTGKDTLEAAK